MSLYALHGHRGENEVCIILNAKDAKQARSRALEKVPELRSRSRVVKIEDEIFVLEIPTFKLPYFSNP